MLSLWAETTGEKGLGGEVNKRESVVGRIEIRMVTVGLGAEWRPKFSIFGFRRSDRSRGMNGRFGT